MSNNYIADINLFFLDFIFFLMVGFYIQKSLIYNDYRKKEIIMTKEQQEKFEEIQSIINQLVYDLEELKTNLGNTND